MDDAESHEAVPNWLLPLMRCPVTHEPLGWPEPQLSDQLHQQYKDAALLDVAGELVETPFDSFLVNRSRTWAHLIRGGILTLSPGEAIPVPTANETEDQVALQENDG